MNRDHVARWSKGRPTPGCAAAIRRVGIEGLLGAQRAGAHRLSTAAATPGERLRESATLYERRRRLLDAGTLACSGLTQLEARLQSHIDILAADDDAQTGCDAAVHSGEPGLVHAAVRVFCRRAELDRVEWAADVITEHSPYAYAHRSGTKRRGLADALNLELPSAWQSELEQGLRTDRFEPALEADLVRAIGYRRLALGDVIAQRALSEPKEPLPYLWALGRVDAEDTESVIQRYLSYGDPKLSSVASIVALRRGHRNVGLYLMGLTARARWSILPSALSDPVRSFPSLVTHTLHPFPAPEALLALGLTGNFSAVDALLQHLESPTRARAAATALHLITGADLQAEAEDDANPIASRPDDGDARDAARPWGQQTTTAGDCTHLTIPGLELDPLTWGMWLDGARARFKPGHRYRLGQPYDPSCALAALSSGRLPTGLRALLLDELQIEHRIALPFEADDLGDVQMQCLAEAQREVDWGTR